MSCLAPTPSSSAARCHGPIASSGSVAGPAANSDWKRATAAAIAGELQITFDQTIALSHVKAGRLRALGVSSPGPDPFAPGIPPIAATLPGVEAMSWLGLFAPAGTPAPVVVRLRSLAVQALSLPEVKQGLADVANSVLTSPSSEEFVRLITSEAERWRAVAAKAHVVIE